MEEEGDTQLSVSFVLDVLVPSTNPQSARNVRDASDHCSIIASTNFSALDVEAVAGLFLFFFLLLLLLLLRLDEASAVVVVVAVVVVLVSSVDAARVVCVVEYIASPILFMRLNRIGVKSVSTAVPSILCLPKPPAPVAVLVSYKPNKI